MTYVNSNGEEVYTVSQLADRIFPYSGSSCTKLIQKLHRLKNNENISNEKKQEDLKKFISEKFIQPLSEESLQFIKTINFENIVKPKHGGRGKAKKKKYNRFTNKRKKEYLEEKERIDEEHIERNGLTPDMYIPINH